MVRRKLKPTPIWKPFPGAQERFLSCPVWEVLLHGNRGGGKSQPVWSKILTKDGFKFMGEISVGTEVVDPMTNELIKIQGIYPQGITDVYRLSVSCGFAFCSFDHLWMIKLESIQESKAILRRTNEIIGFYQRGIDVFVPCFLNGVLTWQKIQEIEFYKRSYCQCIKVDSPDGLYVTDNYLVTHNTDVLLMDFLQDVGKGYGIDYRGLILREATTELADIINKSKKWISQIFPGAKFNGQRKIWTFPGNETLWFNYARLEEDYAQYHGQEIPFIGFEELTNHALPNIYMKLMSCNRTSNSNIQRKYRATCNPSGPGHCVPYGDVLTPSGWVDIKKIEIGDSVFSVDANGEIFETKVSQTHKEYYEGELVSVNKRGLTIDCTPEHSLPKIGGVVGNRNKKFTLLPFKDLPGDTSILRSCEFRGLNPSGSFIVPEYNLKKLRKSRVIQPKKCSWENFAQLLGWFLSEGGTQAHQNSFSIAKTFLHYPNQYKEISNLLSDIGFNFTKNKKGFVIYSRDWFQFFNKFGTYEDKFIPKEYKNWTKKLLTLLFNAMVDGDGHWYTREKSGEYYTTSKRLSSDFCEIALKLGYIIGTRFVKNEGYRPKYTIRFKKTSKKHSNLSTGNHRYNVTTTSKKRNVTKKNYKGFVYCVGIKDTHTFIIRQKNSVWISGNSWVKDRFIDKGAPEEVVKDKYGQTRTHIQSRLEENKALLEADPFYMSKLLAMTQDDKMLRDAWVLGSWDLMAGGFFTDVWDKKIHVLPNFEIPKSWQLLRSFDWGSSKPWAVTYGVEANGEQPPDPDIPFIPKGSVIIIDEIYGWTGTVNEGDQATSQEIAERTLAIDNKIKVEFGLVCYGGPADNAIWEVRDGSSIGHNLSKHGCRWTKSYKGPGSRIAGWALIRQMLGAAKRNDLETPHLYFFSQAAHHVRTLPIQQRDPKKPEDIAEGEDHCMDSLRYLLTRKMLKMKRRKVGY